MNLSQKHVILMLKAAIFEAGGLRALGREWGIQPSYLRDVRDERVPPGPRVLDRLGLRKVVTYSPKERGNS